MASASDGRSLRSLRLRRCGSSGNSLKSVGAIVRELDLTETALRDWVRQAEGDAESGAPGPP